MKKVLLYILAVTLITQVPACAIITTEEQFSAEYIKNHGYSNEMYRLMNLQHDQILGEKPTMNYDVKVYRPWQNGVRTFFMYLDPGLDDQKFMQHDIKYTTRWDSL